ncbi:MAG: dephospho-CoA kinase [Planctomycetes bacterium]|nr:dephospho-CoA kinase [Planctomycetota bacterium]MCP4838838.1 dephospho-CoA kinase [Planctomycetota bacterium]
MIDGVPVIGLAGGVGAGKSTVAEVFESAGCFVVDADVLAKEVLARPETRVALEQWWGKVITGPDGELNPVKVAAIVFKSDAERHRLEALIHPKVGALCAQRLKEAPIGTPAIILDAPLLFEVGLDDWCDRVVYVDAPASLRHARAESRHGWPPGEAATRELAQMGLDEKRIRSDDVVVNAEDRTSLHRQVAGILDRLHPRTD